MTRREMMAGTAAGVIAGALPECCPAEMGEPTSYVLTQDFNFAPKLTDIVLVGGPYDGSTGTLALGDVETDGFALWSERLQSYVFDTSCGDSVSISFTFTEPKEAESTPC